jgi:hypothetical protein
VRDSVDSRLIDQLRSLGKSGAIIKDETSVGGPGTIQPGTPPLDTDRDGIPDAWESAHGLNPSDASDGTKQPAANGYTNLEVYLNSSPQKKSDR